MLLNIANKCPNAVDLGPELREIAQVRIVTKGQNVYEKDETPAGIYYIESGLVGLLGLAPNGNETLHRVFGEHYFFGHRSFITGDKYHATAMALAASKLMFFPFSSIAQLEEKYPKLLTHLAQVLGRELRQAEERYNDLTGKRVINRIIEALIFLKNRYPEYQWTRREIGEFCGAKTETVTRVLTQLEKEGFIEKDGRDINILNAQSLLTFSENLELENS
jgi:CRP-like cAMP-binding protein